MTRFLLSIALLMQIAACGVPPAQPTALDAPSVTASAWPAPQAPFDATPITPVESVGAASND